MPKKSHKARYGEHRNSSLIYQHPITRYQQFVNAYWAVNGPTGQKQKVLSDANNVWKEIYSTDETKCFEFIEQNSITHQGVGQSLPRACGLISVHGLLSRVLDTKPTIPTTETNTTPPVDGIYKYPVNRFQHFVNAYWTAHHKGSTKQNIVDGAVAEWKCTYRKDKHLCAQFIELHQPVLLDGSHTLTPLLVQTSPGSISNSLHEGPSTGHSSTAIIEDIKPEAVEYKHVPSSQHVFPTPHVQEEDTIYKVT